MQTSDKLKCFTFWDTGYSGMPEMIKYIYNHNQLASQTFNFDLVLLTKENVRNYINVHNRFDSLASNFQSDIVRYSVLHKYGGIWLDSDIIILKNLNKLYEILLNSNKDVIVDVEFLDKIGCASIVMKPYSDCSQFCINYLNDYLDYNKPLHWGEIGPDLITILCKKYSNKIILNDCYTVYFGCNFICWYEFPGFYTESWLLDSPTKAETKANNILSNHNCFYAITWTIYRQHKYEDITSLVFRNSCSVFFHLAQKVNCSKPIDINSSSLQQYDYSNIKPNSTKYAVLVASTINVGDDIQTLAAIKLLTYFSISPSCFIDRENLKEYDGESVTLIMNGWFMHDINQFPPSQKITPIFISFHCADENIIRRNIRYFKAYAPIGCRDKNTENMFKKYDIPAYFSGCLTLLFDSNNKSKQKTYIVDINSKCNYIPNVPVELSNYPDVEYIEHDFPPQFNRKDFSARLGIARELLNKYSSAELVITSRLYCALPCRAFNTPIKFIHKNYYNDPRFLGLEDILGGDADNLDGICSNIRQELILEAKGKILSNFYRYAFIENNFKQDIKASSHQTIALLTVSNKAHNLSALIQWARQSGLFDQIIAIADADANDPELNKVAQLADI